MKYHRYHVRMLRGLWEPAIEVRRAELKRLSDLLGDDHDLAVLHRTMLDEPERFDRGGDVQMLAGLIETSRSELQAAARPLGRRLYAEKPKALVRRLRSYWAAWQEEQASGRAADPALPAGV